jgi:DNA-binding transcriptional MerR regulator
MSDVTGTNVDKAPDAFRTISEVADDLDVPQHVLRFWETRFSQIKPMKRGGGRRYYRPDDVDLLRGIRHLLYGEGYTIRGVQRLLKDNGVKFVQSVWKSGAPQPEPPRAEDADEVEDRVPTPGADRAKRRQEPEAAVGTLPSQPVDPPTPSLSGEDLRALQSTLNELGECRRLLDVALKDE